MPDKSTELMLDVKDLIVRYKTKVAVDGVSFSINTKEIFGLLGPNGAGKTSILGAIEGLVKAQSGTISVNGLDASKKPLEVKDYLGVQLQFTSFQPELTIFQIVKLYAALYGITFTKEEIISALTSINLQDEANKRFKQLSGGQQQRVSLLIATIHNPLLVLLDEPTSGLDPQSRRQLWDRIETMKKDNRSILLTTHSMEEAQSVCDRVAIIDTGKIVVIDTPSNLIETYKDDPRVTAVSHGQVTLEDVFIALTGNRLRD